MLTDLKRHHCPDPGPEWDAAPAFGKVRLGRDRILWKSGFRFYAVEAKTLRRAWRQEENVYGKLCLGGRSYTIHRLLLRLEDGTQLTIHIGDDTKAAALELMEAIAGRFPHIAIGKEQP